MSINILDSLIINRISAGEVVESPFSIVKELLDNAIDAKASKIIVEIANGGINQIIVKDNGIGIHYDDINKAFLPHATSKINSVEDLEAICTLGFRGEALASISNVSQTTIVTKTKESDCAYTLDVFGGIFGKINPTTAEVGTKFIINNLFFNTPARRKFLRKPKVEEAQITNIVARYILANPQISFKYVVDNKIIYQSSGNNNLLDAIYVVYGKEITQNLVYVENSIGNVKLSGYVSNIGYSKPNTTYQTLILNSRYVIDEIVSKATYKAFEEYLMPRQFPVYIFNLTMPAVDVDVNVHPSKINIKFANPSQIYDLVYTTIKSTVFKIMNPTITQYTINSNNVSDNLINTSLLNEEEVEVKPNFVELPSKTLKLNQDNYTPITMFDLSTTLEKEEQTKQEALCEKTTDNQDKIPSTNLKIIENSNELIDIASLSNFKIIGTIFNEFIILEKENNMILLDFHAGHERLNYDKFCEVVNNREVVIQDLLIPYTQEVSLNELNHILSLKEDLSQLGFDIDSFGDDKVIINAVPLQLKDINLKNFINDILNDIKNLKPNLNNEIKHYLMQKACKSSVKSGQALSEKEIYALLKNLDFKKPVLLCPHGRPIVTIVNKSQIEKWFKRIV